MAKKQKYYVVWKGKTPGIYTSWEACQEQIKGVKGAIYKAFPSLAAAEEAFDKNPRSYISKKKSGTKGKLSEQEKLLLGTPEYHSIAVDAAVSGNPGLLEYRGVDTKSGKVLFKQGPFADGTNNIGEFLAIVHGLAYLKERKSDRILYSDSRTAISWVRKKACNTQLKPSKKNARLFELIDRAIAWLQTHDYRTPIVKWETQAWGEIPADFGRK